MGLSKLAAGCRACPYVDTCGHKRMEAVGFLPLFQSAAQPAAESAAQPLLRETMEIRVDGKPVTVYVDEIEKQLTRELYAHLGLQYGA
ncbi:hypothetical protein [Anaerotruncus sp. 1XD42-93]|uniref:hypothetical protein n=1 Tax=Anaerotruncus sp. 1XD42-93 TaxID=2320853 RepID=UPI000EA24156|nr:hypothetical protein [Anaerotruncus sp. 1XD42-93]NBK19780.1 hypothetical protein [Anaerotruncus sp. 1XD42-93]RKJ77663.1 hypothetical protein D7Y41_30500 [Anaerotruncus sp. 1XD22-93]